MGIVRARDDSCNNASVLGQGLFLAIEFLARDRISDHLFVAVAIAVHDHHSMSPCAGGMMEVAPDLLLKEWLALPDSLGFDGQVVADHESVFDVHINVSSERTAARARPTFLRLRARRFFKHPMAFSTFDSHVLAAAFYRSRRPRPSVDGVAERNGCATPSSCAATTWEPAAFETRAEPISMCRKRPFATHGPRTPSGPRRRVSYPMSDSMSCIRRAKQHGSETRADKPGRGRLCFPFRHVRRTCGARPATCATLKTRELVSEPGTCDQHALALDEGEKHLMTGSL